MVAGPLDHSPATSIADAEALTGAPTQEYLAACRTVQARVAGDHVVLRVEGALCRGDDHDRAAAHALADVIVALANNLQIHALDVPYSEGLSCGTREHEVQGALEAVVAVLASDGAGDAAAHRTVRVRDLQTLLDRAGIRLDELRDGGKTQHLVVKHGPIGVSRPLARHADPRGAICLVGRRRRVEAAQVDRVGLRQPLGLRRLRRACGQRRLRHVRPHGGVGPRAEQVAAADNLVQRAVAQGREDGAHLLGDEQHEVGHMLRRARELLPELLLLRGDAHRAAVHVADARHDAPFGDHRDAAEAELFAAHHRRDDDVPAGLQTAIHAEGHAIP
mmetsp:Transcript_31535/g.95321  ORF Transcript_31535/g.95321 Transcript_31535/m.95321 type:complete len:333 (+) Transcript_31535:671-1669(+)